MNKFLHNHKKAILTIAGLGAVSAALIAFVYKKPKAKEPITNTRTRTTSQLLKMSLSLSFASTDIPLSTEEPLDFSAIAVDMPVIIQKERVKMAAPFNVEYNEWKYFTVKTMEQFIDALVQYALPSYTELVKTTRDERRNHQENMENYVVSSRDFSYNFDEMMDKCQAQVLRELGLAENLYDNSMTYYMGCCNKEAIKLRAEIPEKLKALLKASKTLTVTELKEILRTQAQITEKFGDNIKIFAENILSPNDVPRVLGDKISDLIFSKFNVEEEDLRAAVECFKEDVEVEQLIQHLQVVSKKLIMS